VAVPACPDCHLAVLTSFTSVQLVPFQDSFSDLATFGSVFPAVAIAAV